MTGQGDPTQAHDARSVSESQVLILFSRVGYYLSSILGLHDYIIFM